MIIGFGIDACAIKRIETLLHQFGEKFLERCFTAHEKTYAEVPDHAIRMGRLAKRFAAKEAAAKALGMGIGAGARLTDIEVRNDVHGKPELFFTGAAADTLHSLLPANHHAKVFVSLSDDAGMAFAQIIIEATEDGKDHG